MTQSKKNRRLRKKLYLDEFKVMGFDFSCKLDPDSGADPEKFFDELVSFIEKRDLMIDIGGSEFEFAGYVTSAGRYVSTTEEDRSALQAMLSPVPGIKDIVVSELSDAYHDL